MGHVSARAHLCWAIVDPAVTVVDSPPGGAVNQASQIAAAPAGGPKLSSADKLAADREAYALFYERAVKSAAVEPAAPMPRRRRKDVTPAPASGLSLNVNVDKPDKPDDTKKVKKERLAEIERNASLLEPALSATIELSFDAVHALALRAEDPHFGTERADRVASLWAKVFAPYVDEDFLKYLLPLLATTTTAKALVSWADEIRAARAPTVIPVDTPAPEPEPDQGGNGGMPERDPYEDEVELGELDCPEAHWS